MSTILKKINVYNSPALVSINLNTSPTQTRNLLVNFTGAINA